MIATISDPPRIKVMIPTGVVKRNMAISTSATTRSDVPDRSHYNSQVVAGVRIAKAINLYATSVYAMLRHARRKSLEARVKSDRIMFHIAVLFSCWTPR
ncbi:MAG TPA: hypothetical protein VFU70_05105 [Pseudolabrys sp.]|nr:hypothetical protein [Pseudolabrys sp.]